MVKILIVEDDTPKLQKITATLAEINGIQLSDITAVVDAHTAKIKMMEMRFDLLLLDIAIPPRLDQEVKLTAGIELLDEVLSRSQYNVPTHIIGITAYPEVFIEASGRFARRLLNIVCVDVTSDEWKEPLRARVRQIISAKSTEEHEPSDHASFAAVICALETPELSSVLRLDWNWEQIHVPNDLTIYYQGAFEVGGQTRNVYAAAASRMGMTASTILCMKMLSAFRPKYLGMVGITAGIPDKAHYGDVIAADPSWDWGTGKWELRDGELNFTPAPHQLSLQPEMRSKLKALSADRTALSAIRDAWPADTPASGLSVHIGPLASGASVVAHDAIVDFVKSQHRQVLGIEMEAYSVFASAEEALAPRPIAFSIKSVVDFADAGKDDRYQKYAAYTSAECLRLLFEKYL